MQKKLHFFIIDDDKTTVDVYKSLIEKAGHRVSYTTNSVGALEKTIDLQPDCILCDLLMPDLDGFDLFQSIRTIEAQKRPTFIIITGKVFEYDRRRAIEMGVDGYLNKPINAETFISTILEIHRSNMVIEFWGSRGTLPVPGKKTLKYGGNTNCVTMRVAKKHFFIFDAGTGIKELSNSLTHANNFPVRAKIFISHPHYDHINGIPFFVPLYMQGNEFEILGTSHAGISIEKLIGNQMDSVYFPITMSEFGAKITFRDLSEETFEIDDLHISTIFLNHPGKCLGYRIQHKNKSFCYITDNELYLEESPNYSQFEVDRLVNFIKDTNVLVIDSTYTDEEYFRKIGWGHSCISRVVDVAHQARVKLLCLYHHDPDQFDKEIEQKLKQAKALLKARRSKTRCIAAREGEKVII
jgi:phosphoribosyl 1,2-cyclic phosphodiesterase/ActR/RegA family two-component response regulator